MRSTLDELDKELNELTALVASITPVNAVLAVHQDSVVQQYVLIRRRFDYAAFIVALYASLEKFIENLVAAYARLEVRRLQYVDLPPKLVRKHILRSAELLSRGRLGEGRYTGLTELNVVKNLFECLNGATPYTLNDAAITAHDLNLRVSEIDALFAAVGIEQICDRIRRTDALLEWYCTAKELDTLPHDGVPTTTVDEQLNNIVERRNQVAHRGGNPDDLLGVSAMNDAIRFIEAFSKSLFAITVGRYLRDHHAVSGLHFRKRYKKGTVVVVEQSTQRLFVGQPVFVIIDATGARWGRIQSIKIDDTHVLAIEGPTPASGIGIALNFKCPTGAALVALMVDDDVVWS